MQPHVLGALEVYGVWQGLSRQKTTIPHTVTSTGNATVSVNVGKRDLNVLFGVVFHSFALILSKFGTINNRLRNEKCSFSECGPGYYGTESVSSYDQCIACDDRTWSSALTARSQEDCTSKSDELALVNFGGGLQDFPVGAANPLFGQFFFPKTENKWRNLGQESACPHLPPIC